MSVGSPCPTCGGGNPLDGDDPVCQCGTEWARPKGRLTRTKGLAPGKGFGQRKPMNRGKPMERSMTPAGQRAAMSRSATKPKPREPRVTPEVRDVVLLRSRGRCEVGVTDACRARGRRLDSPEGTNQHHRHPGGMGGSKRAEIHAAEGLLQVCGQGNTSGCHGWIESNRTAAKERGWLVDRGQDPADVPVVLWNGDRVLLDGASYRAPRTDDVPA